MTHPPRASFAMRSLFALLACRALVARAGLSEMEAWAEGSQEALEEAKNERPDVFGVPPEDVPESMKDIPVAPQNPEELARGLKKLKALLEEGDGGVAKDPEVAEKLAALTEKLKELGVADILDRPEPTELDKHIACVAMSAKTAGIERQSTIDAMALLAKGKMNPQQAGSTVLWRLVGTCIGQITPQVADEFKRGKHTKLPQAYVQASSMPGEEFAAEELDELTWYGLRMTAQRLIRRMDPEYEESEEEPMGGPPERKEASNTPGSEDATPEKHEKPRKSEKSEKKAQPQKLADEERKMPVYFGLLMAVPLLGIFGFLGKIFMSMSRDAEDKKSKKKDKKSR